MKILILRFSSLGDIILTTPVIRCLKLQLPEVEIHYATKKNNAFLLQENPYLDKIHLLGDSEKELVANLKKEGFDLIIDLHRNLRTFRIKTALGSKSASFNKLNIQKWLLVNFKINQMPDLHVVDRYMETLQNLNIISDQKGLDYFIPEKDEIKLLDFGLTAGKYLAYGIGGQHFTKRMPNTKIIELLQKTTKTVVLLGGKEDESNAKDIQNALGKRIVNLCGKINLNQSAWLVKNAEKVISHDTAIMHIASAFKKEIISIWGNTVPEFGMTPYLTKFQVVEVKNLNCRPCSKIGFSKCPKGHFECMNEQNFSNLNL